MDTIGIGYSIPRKESMDKVTGAAKYNSDLISPGTLHIKMVTSIYAHARLKSIDITEAQKSRGVRAILTGRDVLLITGPVMEDRPILAIDKVRYFGEPIALVIADTEQDAKQAANMVMIEYEPLPVINSVSEALKPDAPLIHEQLGNYRAVKSVKPKANSNILEQLETRKGDMKRGWAESNVTVEASFFQPMSDHVAMETRNVRAEIKADGRVIIDTSSQAPFNVREEISRHFGIDIGKVIIRTPLVGGGFGGKAAIQLEFLTYVASRAVGGRPVRLSNTREEDMVSSPVRLGIEAKIKLGCTSEGELKAAEFTFMVENGAYADSGPRMAKAIAANCTGPYNVENLSCETICVYTKHSFATAFRGFGHIAYTFVMERALDMMAFKLKMNPIELRLKNAIKPEQTTPTQTELNESNVGNLATCVSRLKELINWDEGQRIELGNNKVKAKGISCFWKTSSSPTNATSGVILTYNPDGSINMNTGFVEIGPGMKTTMAQILAEKMKMDVGMVHVNFDVDTQLNPKHWKTVASMTTYLAGRAVLAAADDLIRQLRSLASMVLRCPSEDLDVAQGKAFVKDDPGIYIDITEIVFGYKYPNGNAIGGQIMAHGNFIMRQLTSMDPNTGRGRTGPGWTVGAQAVEVEFDPAECTYRVVRAATVVDAGKVINPKTARGVIMGGMCMGLGIGSSETFIYNEGGIVQNPQLRSYKPLRFGEEPEYLVEFVETPQIDAPYGARAIGEHGILGLPAALANALASASGVELNQIPLTPEFIWKKKKEANK